MVKPTYVVCVLGCKDIIKWSILIIYIPSVDLNQKLRKLSYWTFQIAINPNQEKKSCVAPYTWPGSQLQQQTWSLRWGVKTGAWKVLRNKTFITRKSLYFLLRYFCKRIVNLSCISSTCLLSTRSSISGQNSRSSESKTYSSAVWKEKCLSSLLLGCTRYRRPGANIPKQVRKLAFHVWRRAWEHRGVEHLLGVQFFNLQLFQPAV